MTEFVHKEHLAGVFPYLDNLTTCGKDQDEHDTNLEFFLAATKRRNMTYNDEKSVFSTRCLAILGCVLEEGEIRPVPERLRLLQEFLFRTVSNLSIDVKGYSLNTLNGFLGFQTE